MNNNTERLARNWAEMIKSASEGAYGLSTIAAAEHILATPTASETMEDVEWDDDEHHLTGAATDAGIDVVMLWHNEDTDLIVTNEGEIQRDRLTPNGKRYELREISKPEHTETLTTAEDFEDAPEGTIVADSFVNAYQKGYADCWVSSNDELTDKEMAASGPWLILRCGWENNE